MAKYIIYNTKEQRKTLFEWCKKYKVQWNDGKIVSKISDLYYGYDAYIAIYNDRSGVIGGIRRGDDVEYARRVHGIKNEYRFFDAGRIADYLSKNKNKIITEELFIQLIGGSNAI